MDFKKTNAPLDTITYDRNVVDAKTDNIYEAISNFFKIWRGHLKRKFR